PTNINQKWQHRYSKPGTPTTTSPPFSAIPPLSPPPPLPNHRITKSIAKTKYGSWEPPKNPKEAQAKLAFLRRDYAKQVKEPCKEYIHEMELQREEQLRKDEARKAEILQQREKRNKSKAAATQARAAERKAFEEEFRNTLVNDAEMPLNWEDHHCVSMILRMNFSLGSPRFMLDLIGWNSAQVDCKMKERTEKLDYWRMREKSIEEKKNSKKELIHRQSGKWIEEGNMEAMIMRALVDHPTQL
uniref:Uncharacterized protein n=1 Tax=Chenopodium quinoa TaxID=63459 RepID=A0A803M807_CHEQI